MKETTIDIAKDFSDTPGARYKTDGPFSGEQFREEILEPAFNEYDHITVILDGTEGYATSFLEESFGELSRRYGADAVEKKITFISNEDPLLIKEIMEYISEAIAA